MPSNLDPAELQALMGALQDGKPEAPATRPAVVPYDLTSQDRVIRGQLPTLDAINEQIASTASLSLTGRVRMSLRLEARPASLVRFSELSPVLVPPLQTCVLSLGGGGEALLAMEPQLSDALLAAALGERRRGGDEAGAPRRAEYTAVERQVLRRLLSAFTDAITAAWQKILPLQAEISRFESDPRAVVLAPPNEAAALCPFAMSGALKGKLDLVIPYSVLEPAKKQLTSSSRTPGADRRFLGALEAELTQVPVELRALLGATRLPLSRLLTLEVGDVLTLDHGEDEPLDVLVQDRKKLVCHPQVKNGAVAIQIVRPLAAHSSDSLPPTGTDA